MLSNSGSNAGQSARAYTTLHRAGLVPAETEDILIHCAGAPRTAAATAMVTGPARQITGACWRCSHSCATAA